MSFPKTRHSVLLGLRSDDAGERRLAGESLVGAYWRPVYAYLRLRWKARPEDAEDLTQGFFARALEKGYFDRYDQARARFRTFLRTCLDAYVQNERQAATRLKRGGGAVVLGLDFQTAEGDLVAREIPDGTDLDALFQREWVRALFADALAELRRRCEARGKPAAFALFERYDVIGEDAGARPTYEELAREHALPVTQVTNHLHWARREFRAAVLETLRAATASEQEFRAEAREILGVDPE